MTSLFSKSKEQWDHILVAKLDVDVCLFACAGPRQTGEKLDLLAERRRLIDSYMNALELLETAARTQDDPEEGSQ